MKHNLKIFFIALFIGMSLAFLISYKIDPTEVSNAIDSKITYFYIGSYNNETDALNKSKTINSIVFKNNNVYQVIIGIYHKKETIMLMESYFKDQNISYEKNIIKVDSKLLNDINSYEELIIKSDKKYYNNINESILKLFNEYNN